MLAPKVEFTLKCRVAGCKEQTTVRVVRSTDPRSNFETSSLLAGEGWQMIFRDRDGYTLLAAALCPEHL